MFLWGFGEGLVLACGFYCVFWFRVLALRFGGFVLDWNFFFFPPGFQIQSEDRFSLGLSTFYFRNSPDIG